MSTSKHKTMILSQKRVEYAFWVGNESVSQVLLMSERRCVISSDVDAVAVCCGAERE